jgi:hypothetical protein
MKCEMAFATVCTIQRAAEGSDSGQARSSSSGPHVRFRRVQTWPVNQSVG